MDTRAAAPSNNAAMGMNVSLLKRCFTVIALVVFVTMLFNTLKSKTKNKNLSSSPFEYLFATQDNRTNNYQHTKDICFQYFHRFSKNSTTSYQYKKRDKNWKRIIIWTDYFGKKNLWGKVFQRHCLEECEETRCEFTGNHRKVGSADAILFDINSLDLVKNLSNFNFPKERRQNQIYIFFTMEPPTRLSKDLHRYNNFFNWTMTYRTDSDVFVPYGTIIKRNKEFKVKYLTQEEIDKKKLAIWLNSHCMQSPRNNFAKNLQRFLNIDVFGNCVNRVCGTRAVLRLIQDEVGKDSCEKSFENYLFFMALENSLCKDYVTEKLYRSLKLGIVPVMFGAVNYTEFAPPESFIDSKDFGSIAELATYLTKVAGNASLYNEYLKWQEEYDIDVGTPYKPLICDLCKKLHSKKVKSARYQKSYESIHNWFIGQGNCKR